METSGNIVWQNTYGNQYYDRIANSKGILIKNNSIYIAGRSAGNYTDISPNPTVVGYLIKTDLQGNLIWEKKYVNGKFNDEFVGIQEWDRESFILGGQSYNYSTSNEYPVGWLMKVDTNGKTIWERTIQKYTPEDNAGDEPHHYVHDMLVSSDKGILLGGYIIANYITDENGYYHRNDAWLAKTDSCGFTVGDVPQASILIDSIVKRKVYLREKSQAYCTAVLTWGDQSQDTSYYAYENNLPLQEKQLVHTFAENGEYTIKTTALAGEEFREASITVSIYYKDDSIIEPEPPIYGMLSIFPNPTVNFATIQNPQSQTKDLEIFSIELYSINGKKLQSYKLNPKLYQQQINVSTLSNGIYYVKFIIDKTLVETVKVVIAKG